MTEATLFLPGLSPVGGKTITATFDGGKLSSNGGVLILRKLATLGKVILQEKCARCHAIEAVGESPLKKAPPMRDIYARFNPRECYAPPGGV
jgi:hypothetical protein